MGTMGVRGGYRERKVVIDNPLGTSGVKIIDGLFRPNFKKLYLGPIKHNNQPTPPLTYKNPMPAPV